MSDLANVVQSPVPGGTLLDKKKSMPSWVSGVIVAVALLGGLGYIGLHVAGDLGNVTLGSTWPYVLLATALLIALAFEFVNGFHDTANAVATVIYTHSLDPNIAVVWSGLWNLIGVLTSAGAVAFTIITLLPVELILKVSSGAGFAMVFALLIAAILWNLGTWWLGLPASSTHTMTGSIIGVGLANQWMNVAGGTSGVDWEQAMKVFRVLLISPLVGFGCAAILFMVLKPKTRTLGCGLLTLVSFAVCMWLVGYGMVASALIALAAGAGTWLLFRFIPTPDALFRAPENDQPPPFAIRALLVLTCTGVSFSHGSNDGQKGMGLIMLILIGTVPTAYALNHAVTGQDIQDFLASSQQAAAVVDRHVNREAVMGDPRTELTDFLRTRKMVPSTLTALRETIHDLEGEVKAYGTYKNVPANQQSNVRNDMYVTSETLRILAKTHQGGFDKEDNVVLDNYKKHVDKATRFIPTWVKVAVALALGLGTMVGWKRIVVTVGEKIGKEHLTYAQGAAAELVAMATIRAADVYGLPVSTTHVLSSGVAGTMAANNSGLQLSTLRNIAAAWVFTLPAAALLSGLLFWGFRQFTN
jgi:PiT family inorganic phosphate transporter